MPWASSFWSSSTSTRSTLPVKQVVHAVEDADGVGDDGVGAGGAQVIGRKAFEDFVRQAVGGGEGELERGGIGDAGAVEVGGRDLLLGGQRFDLRGGAVDEHDADVQRAQHGDVHQDVGEVLVGDDRAVHVDDERLLAELGDVLQDAPQVGQFHVRLRLDSGQEYTRRRFGFGESRFEGLQAALVLFGRADGDANPLGQLVAAHRPHDHAQSSAFR